MPPPNVSEGFSTRNIEAGQEWKALLPQEKSIFKPDLFHQLAISCYVENLPSTADASTIATLFPTSVVNLTAEELQTFTPTYKKLVNTEKVHSEINKGRFGQGTGYKQEDRSGRMEIGKVAGCVSWFGAWKQTNTTLTTLI